MNLLVSLELEPVPFTYSIPIVKYANKRQSVKGINAKKEGSSVHGGITAFSYLLVHSKGRVRVQGKPVMMGTSESFASASFIFILPAGSNILGTITG